MFFGAFPKASISSVLPFSFMYPSSTHPEPGTSAEMKTFAHPWYPVPYPIGLTSLFLALNAARAILIEASQAAVPV